MNIDSKELQALALTTAPRLDMYAGIHKALRAFMADTLLAVGRMDSDDELEFAQVTERVLQLLDVCRLHLDHENRFVHAAMERRAPGSAARIAEEHKEHERHIEQLAGAVVALRSHPAATRAVAAFGLYHELSAFMADNFQHMLVEETEHNAVLWAQYSDEELAALHAELVGAVPPAELMLVLRWMVPFMNPAERAAMLQDMRAHAPAPAFQAVLDTVRGHLTQREWDKLAGALHLA